MSRFKGILNAAKSREPEPEQEQTEESARKEPVQEPESTTSTELVQQPTPQAETKRGRPKGKRSNPDYEQVTAYIRRATYRDVKIALLQKADSREFSELVEDLLREWLKS